MPWPVSVGDAGGAGVGWCLGCATAPQHQCGGRLCVLEYCLLLPQAAASHARTTVCIRATRSTRAALVTCPIAPLRHRSRAPARWRHRNLGTQISRAHEPTHHTGCAFACALAPARHPGGFPILVRASHSRLRRRHHSPVHRTAPTKSRGRCTLRINPTRSYERQF